MTNTTETTTHTLQCEMSHSCTAPVAMIDSKGFIYCTAHGMARRDGYHHCRKLRPFEIRRLEKGLTVTRY